MLFGLDKHSQVAKRVRATAAAGIELPEDNIAGTYRGKTKPCTKDYYQKLQMCSLI